MVWTLCAPGARMWARGLLYPLFVVRIRWFDMADVCSTKVKWVEQVSKAMKYVTALTFRWALR